MPRDTNGPPYAGFWRPQPACVRAKELPQDLLFPRRDDQRGRKGTVEYAKDESRSEARESANYKLQFFLSKNERRASREILITRKVGYIVVLRYGVKGQYKFRVASGHATRKAANKELHAWARDRNIVDYKLKDWTQLK